MIGKPIKNFGTVRQPTRGTVTSLFYYENIV